MFLTGQMFAAAFCAGVAAWLAHRLIGRRTYHTPIPRYIVGVALCLVPWSLAVLAAPLHPVNVIVGAWLVFAAAGAGTWIGYEQDRPVATLQDVERLAALLSGEHADEPSRGD